MLTECSPNSHEDLARRIASSNYRQLVSEGSVEAEEIWANGGNVGGLKAIVSDKAQPARVRFLALELWWSKKGELPAEISKSQAASVLVPALSHTPWIEDNWGLSGNDWGFLWYMDANGIDGARQLGQHLIALGEEALPPLIALLSDDSLIEYEGSKEAMLGNDLSYRVKDLAAYFIGRITGDQIPFEEEISKRDALIKKLKAGLE
jgi:hypothetical protein